MTAAVLQFAKPLIDFELSEVTDHFFTFTSTVHFHGSYKEFMNDERKHLFYINDDVLRNRFLVTYFNNNVSLIEKDEYVETGMKILRVVLRSARIICTKNTFPCDLELSCPIINTDHYPRGNITVHRSTEHVMNGLKLNRFQQQVWDDLDARIGKIGMFSWSYLTYHEKYIPGYFEFNRKKYSVSGTHPLILGLKAIKRADTLTVSKSNKDVYRIGIHEYEEYKREVVKATDALPVADGLFFQLSRTCGKSWADLDFLNELSSDEVVKAMHLNKAASLEVEFQFEMKYIIV